MQAGVVITRARYTLLDPNGVYWTDAELISYLNGGISQIIAIKPDAYVVTAAMTLAAGIDQSLPSGGVQFLEVFNNVTSGTAVIKRDLAKLSQANPGWSAQTAAVDVNYLLPDVRDPTRFRVSPPNTGTGQIRVMYCASPAALTSLTDTIPLTDVYQSALWAFVVGSAYGKNSSKGDVGKMQEFLAMVPALATAKTQLQIAEGAKTEIPDGGT